MENTKNLGTPIAIVIAGGLIALAVFFSGGGSGAVAPTGNNNNNGGSDFGNNNSAAAGTIRPVDENDYVFGNPDAPVTIVEYSDFECPFCSRLHPTLVRIVEESDGQVNWVYRHLPLTSIHPNAEPAARASECVARLGGNDAFWAFGDVLFANQRTLSSSLYTQAAEQLGISADALTSCMAQADVAARVQQDLDEAVAAGGRGTPFSIIVSAEGQFFPFSGALPYEQVKPLVDQALVN